MLRSGLLSLAAGVVAAAVGLLPWLATGAGLPLQEFWDRTPKVPPVVLLPYSNIAVTTIVALLVSGAAVGGMLARIPRLRRGLVLLGVLLGQAAAVVQTDVTVQSGQEHRFIAFVYLAALVGGSIAAMVLGAVVLLLVAARHRAAVVVGAGLAAVPAASWIGAAAGLPPFADASAVAWLDLLRWVPPVIVGAAVGWAGLGRAGRVVAALFALLALWVGPALVTAAQYAAGSRALLHQVGEAVGGFASVFVAALLQPAIVLPELGVAIAIAAVVLVARRLVGGTRARSRPAVS